MIAALRQALVADLAVLDVPVHTAWPDRITPPCVFVTPPAAAPYVISGPQFGQTYTVALDVVLLADKAAALVALEALETLIEGVLTNTVDWSLSGVDSPALVTVNGSEYLGTVAHLSKPTRLIT